MKSRILAAALVLAALTGPARAMPVPKGPEFQVNAYTTGYQGDPSVATDAAGNYMVVWYSIPGDGDLAGVFARRFDSSGSAIGGEFQVNTYTTSAQVRPVAAMNGPGEFVVIWLSSGQDGSSAGLFGRLFSSNGAPEGSEFQVNTWTSGAQSWASVDMNSSGDFVVAWSSAGQDGNDEGIFARLFGGGALPLGTEFQVNTYTTGPQIFPDIDLDDTGEFTVVWQSPQDGGGDAVVGRVFDPSGAPLIPEVQINTTVNGSQRHPSVAMDGTGGFLAVYDSDDGSLTGVWGQMVSSSGMLVGSEFLINSNTSGRQGTPSIERNAQGSFIVIWDGTLDAGSREAIFSRSLDPNGAPRGAEFQVSQQTSGNHFESALAMDSHGDFVVTWSSYPDQDGDYYGVFGRRFLGSSPVVTSHQHLDMVDCGDPRNIRPTFTWTGDDYDRFKIHLGTNSAFVKRSFLTSGDKWRRGGSWTPSKKKWRKACKRALAESPANPMLFVRIVGKDRDLRKADPARIRTSPVVLLDVEP